MTRIWPSIAQAVNNATHTAHPPLRWDPANHLLSRFAFGPSVATRHYVATRGVVAWYQHELVAAAAYHGYRGNPAVAACGPLLAKTPAQTMFVGDVNYLKLGLYRNNTIAPDGQSATGTVA